MEILIPPNTLTQIASAIQRHLWNKCEKSDISLLKKDDPVFAGFRLALDATMKELTADGIGVKGAILWRKQMKKHFGIPIFSL